MAQGWERMANVRTDDKRNSRSSSTERVAMFSLLHLRRGWRQPPREHHGLGVDPIPHALPDDTIDKRDIFHYVYALLLHADYRERYAANLKRDLPRLPYARDFRGFAEAGARLAEIHVGYEDVEEYRGENPGLQLIETPGLPLDWRGRKDEALQRQDATKYNDYLTLAGIPSKAFDYRLGNRSALEWVTDQYRVKTDKRSGIVNDPNRADDPQYIIRLIRKVISVSLETVSIVEALPELRV